MREQKAKEYLRTIFALEMEGPVRGAYIAREMNVTKATVSVALKALAEEGYLRMEKDHRVLLTESGRHLARESIHQTVKNGRNYHELVQHLQQRVSDITACVWSIWPIFWVRPRPRSARGCAVWSMAHISALARIRLWN